MKFSSRKLRIKDVGELFKLFNTVLQEDFPEYQPRAAYIYRNFSFNKKFFTNFIKNNKNLVIGIFSDNKLIAFANVWGQSGGVGNIEWLMVDSKWRQKGVGSLLLKKIEDWANRTKRHYLYLHTESHRNREYYSKRGWRYVGVQKSAWMGVDEHLMEKHLRDKPFEKIFEKYENKSV